MAREFTPEQPQQEGDERAAGKKQLHGEIRADTAEIFHTSSFGAPRSDPMSGPPGRGYIRNSLSGQMEGSRHCA
jgi:hypothetical protein